MVVSESEVRPEVPTGPGSVRPAGVAGPAARARRARRIREYLLFTAFIAPNFLLLGVFSYWPVPAVLAPTGSWTLSGPRTPAAPFLRPL